MRDRSEDIDVAFLRRGVGRHTTHVVIGIHVGEGGGGQFVGTEGQGGGEIFYEFGD